MLMADRRQCVCVYVFVRINATQHMHTERNEANQKVRLTTLVNSRP